MQKVRARAVPDAKKNTEIQSKNETLPQYSHVHSEDACLESHKGAVSARRYSAAVTRILTCDE